MNTALNSRISEISSRSRLNQNVIIDQSGLRIGRKIWVARELLPTSIQNAVSPLCAAIRNKGDLQNLIDGLPGNKGLLRGEETFSIVNGISVTSNFNRFLFVTADSQRVRKFVSPSLGLERIAAFLRHNNPAVDVQIFDTNLEGDVETSEAADEHDPGLASEKLFSFLLHNRFDAVGFSVLTGTFANDARNIMRAAQAFTGKQKPVFAMGNYGVLSGATELFDALEPLDVLVWGPGEEPMLKLLELMQGTQNPLETERLATVFSELSEAHFTCSSVAVRGRNIPSFPKDKHFEPTPAEVLNTLNPIIDQYAIGYERYWETYRDKPKNLRFHVSGTSCPYQCTFCCLTKGGITFMDPKLVVEMFEHARLAYPHISRFSFTDDNLFIQAGRHIRQLAAGFRASKTWIEGDTISRERIFPQFNAYREALKNIFLDVDADTLVYKSDVTQENIAELLPSDTPRDLIDLLVFNRGFLVYCQARADSFDPDDTRLLQDVYAGGFRIMAMGRESFSVKALREFNKALNLRRADNAIDLLRAHNISVIVDLILFPPNVVLTDLFDTFKASIDISKDPEVDIDPNFMLSAYPGAPLTEKLEALSTGREYTGKAAAALNSQSWVEQTRIIYTVVNGLSVPHHFTIIRPLMDSLCQATKKLSKTAIKETKTDANDLGRKGLMIVWAALKLVEKNRYLFNDQSSGEGTSQCIDEFIGLIPALRQTITVRYSQEKINGEQILKALDSIKIPGL